MEQESGWDELTRDRGDVRGGWAMGGSVGMVTV